MKLYELSTSLLAIYQQVDNEEADIDCLEDSLQAVEGAIEIKAEGIGRLIKMLDADADLLAAEIKRLTDRKRARETRIAKIKTYLQQNMELIGRYQISTPTMTISLQDNPESVDVYDIHALPEQYQRKTISSAPDKDAIKKAIKSGAEIPGAALMRSRRLAIK